MKEGDFLIALITSQLKKEKLNIELIKEIEKGDINKLYRLSCMHSVTNIISDALKENGVNIEKELLSKFKNEKLKLNLKSQRLNYDVVEIFNALEENGVYFIPLKGIVVKDYYPREDMRFSTDVDILIKKQDEKKVNEILTKKCNLKFYKSYQDEKTYITPSGEFLETHVDIADGEKTYARVFENLFEICKSKGNKQYQLEMNGEYLAVHNVTHLVKHFKDGGCGIRPILDAYIIKEKIGYNEETVLSLLSTIGLDKFYTGIMNLVDCFFNGKQYSKELQIIKEFILTGGNYGSLENKVLLDSASENKTANFFRKAFPSVSYLKGKYQVLEKCVILYPFCIIHRWFSILFGKRKRLAKEISEKKQLITEEKRQEILSMQDYLGIK